MENIYNNATVSKWEILILKSIRSKAKTEKKIAKDVSLNISIVSQLITSLMMQGFVERIRMPGFHFSPKECFFATIEGVEILEKSINHNGEIWNQIMSLFRDRRKKTSDEYSGSLLLNLAMGSIKTSIKLARFILK